MMIIVFLQTLWLFELSHFSTTFESTIPILCIQIFHSFQCRYLKLCRMLLHFLNMCTWHHESALKTCSKILHLLNIVCMPHLTSWTSLQPGHFDFHTTKSNCMHVYFKFKCWTLILCSCYEFYCCFFLISTTSLKIFIQTIYIMIDQKDTFSLRLHPSIN